MKSVNGIQHINQMRGKKHKIISTDAEKSFGKIQYHFMIKNKSKTLKLKTDSNFLNMVKGIYEKPTVNTILSGERKSCPPMIRYKTRMLILEVLESN